LENPQHGTDRSVSLVDSDQRSAIKNRAHAAPRLWAAPRAAATASSSSSLKGPSSASQRSSASPS